MDKNLFAHGKEEGWEVKVLLGAVGTGWREGCWGPGIRGGFGWAWGLRELTAVRWNKGQQVQQGRGSKGSQIQQSVLRGTSGMGPWPWVKIRSDLGLSVEFSPLLPALLLPFSKPSEDLPTLNLFSASTSRQPSAVRRGGGEGVVFPGLICVE
ncbi:unnamed protein product [Rangifer tarandus platyrhynchus]|uniref:Uncharacterized protein n=2 Tax=Rangifer tarandus platyrhynchus TaxID=3082113 RepID=A0ABN8YBM5_RANTA|nr:unnamed protein product [Rangifer tarandus platyrhynchus]